MIEISSCIDWLSLTFHSQSIGAKWLFNVNYLGEHDDHKAQFGYSNAVKYECGIVVMWSTQRDDMGMHVIMSGSALEYLAAHENDVRWLLKSAVDMGAKTTRLDLAIDAKNCNVDIMVIYDACKAGLSKGTAQNINIIQGVDGSATLYVGSRQSDKFCRLYDKGIQSKLGGDWKRLEVELKGDVAKQYARVVAANGDKSISEFTWSTASKMMFVDAGNYPVLGTESKLLSMPKIEKQTDTEKWLCTQVIPVIEKFIREHPESTVYDELITALIRAKGQSS